MSARETLRRVTNDRHRALDSLVMRSGFFDHLEGYGRWLMASHAFHTQLTSELQSFGADLPLSPDCLASYRGALERDLSHLSLAPGRVGNGCPIGPSDTREALAVLYVAQGASLGARLLVARTRALGLDGDHGAEFLEAQSRERAGWQAILDELARVPAEPDTLARMGSVSCRTFDAAIWHFGQRS
jgi:heme oxygenase